MLELLPEELLVTNHPLHTNTIQMKPLLQIFATILLRILTLYRMSGVNSVQSLLAKNDMFSEREREFALLFEDEQLLDTAIVYLSASVELFGLRAVEHRQEQSENEPFALTAGSFFSKYPAFTNQTEMQILTECLTKSIQKNKSCPIDQSQFFTTLHTNTSSLMHQTTSIMHQIQQLTPAHSLQLRQLLVQAFEWRHSIRKSHPTWPKQHKLRQRTGYPGSKDAFYSQTFSKMRNVVGTVLGVLLMGLFLGGAVWMRIGAWENEFLQDDEAFGAELEEDCVDFVAFDRETMFFAK